ncbi:unnamed protein product [Linum trigynum]|uniref:Reverse transcriptase domain-containing protein n=1 Tax=Linum trigynum TaxID=586398 RepID=A0AAV2DU10_9ROSI
MWLLDISFDNHMEEWWSGQPDGIGDMFVLEQKLKHLKGLIKVWNKEEFGIVEKRIAEILGKVKEIDMKEEESALSEDDLLARSNLKCNLDQLLIMEEISWRQKSREIWLKRGDKNTNYFHKMASYNRRRNLVSNIRVNGVLVEGQEALKEAFVGHFNSVFIEDLPERPFPAQYGNYNVSEEDCELLTRPFTEEEVWNIVRRCTGDKAPGPDGYSFAFFKKQWGVIKEDVLKAFNNFHYNGRIPRCIAHSFFCLIPKKEAVEEIRDFRPISLRSSVNKLLSKTITERHRSVVMKAVSGNQFGGLKGRQIHEASLIANELIDSRRKSGKPGLVFKLDIEKAFDNVNWNCLFKILDSFCFPQRAKLWIKGLVTSPVLSVLVNGEAAGFFKTHKGLRQGDPMSPFLFLLVMDILSAMLETLRSEGCISGFFMDEPNSRGEVTHLLYVDDTIIFCEANEEHVLNLLSTLVCFQAVTGLRINVEKSMMFPVGSVQNPEIYACIFGCGWSYLPTIYLGLPLGASPNSTAVWNRVLLRFQTRLECWRSKFLSLGGRIILCKSCLSSQPLFQFSLLRAPKATIHKMEQMQRSFIWSGAQDKSKYHLVRWDLCKATKDRGGLGVLDLDNMNLALLAKWFWKFATEPNSWWRQLIEFKFPNPLSIWRSGSGSGPLGCSMWKRIMKEEDSFWKSAHISPGGGAWVSFWNDCWWPGMILKDAYPRVAAASMFQEAWVSNIVSFESEGVGWDLQLSISLMGGAERERLTLMHYLSLLPLDLITTGPAKLIWNSCSNGGFSVKSMYDTLNNARFHGIIDFPCKVIWQPFVPMKVNAFLWLLRH